MTRRLLQSVQFDDGLDEPESPSFSPDGGSVAFNALRNGDGDIFTINLGTRVITNLTEDPFMDRAPSYSPDGTFLVYTARVSGNDKLFRLDLDTRKKTQITFGTQDETGAQFIDDHTIVFASTATDPAVPLDPEIVRNGNILNIWTLDLKAGELRQYTDAVGGNWSPAVLNEGASSRVAFVSYFRNEYSIRVIERKEPLHTAQSTDFGAPGAIIDFRAPLQHTLIAANTKKKGIFEKMFIEGRPPINVGVTSNGDIFGGTQITMADALGDQQLNFFASSISQYRTVALSYVNLSRRFQWALQGFDQTTFYYATGSQFYDPAYSSLISRDDATSTRTIRGGVATGIYPLDRYRRVELSAGLYQISEQYTDASLQAYSEQYQQATYGTQVFANGTLVPFSAAFLEETTVFREFGPLSGHALRLAYEVDPKIAGSLSRQTVDVDLRHYFRLGTTGLIATRFKGFRSFGQSPSYSYFGGNSEMRGYDYLQFVGQNAVFANAELRFPLIEAALTPVGVVGGVRGVFFGNVGAGWFDARVSRLPAGAPLCRRGRRCRASVSRTAERPMDWAWKPSRLGFRSTSIGHGARCSTRIGRTWSLRRMVAVQSFDGHDLRCGLATTFEPRVLRDRRCKARIAIDLSYFAHRPVTLLWSHSHDFAGASVSRGSR